MLSSDYTHLHALVGGVLIGVATLLGAVATGVPPGISGLCSGVLKGEKGEVAWRAVFLLGLIAGAVIAFRLVEAAALYRPPRSVVAMVLAGLLVGLGTRVGGGCTSGHGVCGLGLGSKRSLVATLVFMITGMITVFVLAHVRVDLSQ